MALKDRIENNIALWFLGTLLTGFLAGIGTYQAILSIANLKVIGEAKFAQLLDKQRNDFTTVKDSTLTSLPIKEKISELEATWVNDDTPLLIFSNQVMIKISGVNEFIRHANITIDLPNNKPSTYYMTVGQRESFEYKSGAYWLYLLDVDDGSSISPSRAKITISLRLP